MAHQHNADPLPDTDTAAILQAINVKPAQIAELAHMPLSTVQTAIADGRARPGVRDLAGWVVSLLRTHRDYGWKITPPAPAHDSPEALRAAFARYASEHDAPWEEEPCHAALPDDAECIGAHDAGPVGTHALPSLVHLWNGVQLAMTMRIPRQEFRTWIQPAVLRSVEQGTVTISVPNTRIKDGIEQRYSMPLGELFTAALGTPIHLRVTIHAPASLAEARCDAVPVSTPPDSRSPTLALPQPEPDRRPDWVRTERWIGLPAMLRAALIGSTLEEGAIQAASPHLIRLIETRYPREAAALIAAAKDDAASASSEDSCT